MKTEGSPPGSGRAPSGGDEPRRSLPPLPGPQAGLRPQGLGLNGRQTFPVPEEEAGRASPHPRQAETTHPPQRPLPSWPGPASGSFSTTRCRSPGLPPAPAPAPPLPALPAPPAPLSAASAPAGDPPHSAARPARSNAGPGCCCCIPPPPPCARLRAAATEAPPRPHSAPTAAAAARPCRRRRRLHFLPPRAGLGLGRAPSPAAGRERKVKAFAGTARLG